MTASREATPDLDRLEVALREAGREPEVAETASGARALRFFIPHGRRKRWRRVSELRAGELLDLDVVSLSYLGDYDAIWHKETGLVEAIVRLSPGTLPSRLMDQISHLAGAETLGPEGWVSTSSPEVSAGSDADVDEEADASAIESDAEPAFRLPVRTARYSITLGPPSRVMARFSSTLAGVVAARNRAQRWSLAIEGLTPTTHDEALAILEDLGGSFLFDLELRHGIGLQPAAYAEPLRRRAQFEPSSLPPQAPTSVYAARALSLYRYASAARGMNLLSFLAYYQVLEYFFPMHTQAESLQRARIHLRDPRFDLNDDAQLTRLLTLGSGTRGKSEREQLKVSLRASTTADDIRSFLDADPDRWLPLEDKQTIKGVAVLRSQDKATDLRDQAADRIYDIRCRVVHTKDGEGSAGEILLPSSPEATALSADVDFIRFLAQRALIAGARTPRY